MNVMCNDRERILLDGSPQEWAALELHAATCEACAEEVRAWKQLSTAAEELREYGESPALWSRIEESLRQQSAGEAPRRGFWQSLSAWPGVSLGWQAALVGALALVLALSGAYVYKHRTASSPDAASNSLLKSGALAEVERAEREYMRAIDKLAAEAAPQLNADTSLMANYREKLLVLDNAIGDLRAQAGENPSNAHLRSQILAMYEEKQQTLQDVLETKR